MPTFSTYKNIKVSLLRSTDKPKDLVNLATTITMKKDLALDVLRKKLKSRIKFLISADHTSVLEHLTYTFLVEGASRSYLAQMTRHRIASYTSGSQHYQNYEGYGARIVDGLSVEQRTVFEEAIQKSMDAYSELMSLGVPKYEARQVLPNAMENNLLITMNARSLINFFKLRLCLRNTKEINVVAIKMYKLCLGHFPELFELVGTPCMMDKCNQGKMSCGKSLQEVKAEILSEK